MQILRKQKLNIQKSYLYLTALLFSCVVIIQVGNSNSVESLRGVIKYAILFLANYFIWAFLIDYIYGAIQSNKRKNKNFLKSGVEVVASLILLLIFHLIITNIIYYTYLLGVTDLKIVDVFDDFKPFLLKSILSRVLDLTIIIILMKLIEGYWTLQKKKLEVISLESQLNRSQLEALRAQLDPHFLFNTLHTLNTLIGYDDSKAKSMVIKVTHLLRKMLDQRGKHFISFEEELDYFRSYLEIEQERFHDRLEIIIDVEEETKLINVPTLILQPLIENAFKHGIALIEGNGKIHLIVKIQNNKLAIVLENTIPKVQHSAMHSTKVGLENLKSRLDQSYGKDYHFSVEKNSDMFMVTLLINTLK